MTTQHIIFDLDGTLFDTEYMVSEITADLAAGQGMNISPREVFRAFAGLGAREKFEAIAESRDVKLPGDVFNALAAAHEERKAGIYQGDIPVMPHAAEMLDLLSRRGHALSVGTSNPSARAVTGLEKTGLLHYFNERVYGPDMVGGLKKPDPAVFLFAMKQSGIAAGSTTVVEDTVAGIRAGAAAGAAVIALVDPRFGKSAAAVIDKYSVAGAGRIVRNLDTVRKIFSPPGNKKRPDPAKFRPR